MTAVSTITLPDAQATPVDHVFIPIGPDTNGVWWFEDQSSGSSVGFNRISLSLVRAPNPAPGSNAKDRVNRVKVGIHTPKLETVGTSDAGYTPAPTVAYIPRFNCEFILPDRASVQDRKDILKYGLGLLDNAALEGMVESLQGLY